MATEVIAHRPPYEPFVSSDWKEETRKRETKKSKKNRKIKTERNGDGEEKKQKKAK